MGETVVQENPKKRRGRTVLWWTLGILGILALVGVFLMFGPPRLADTFAEPSFCGTNCHEMNYVYVSWQEEEHSDLDSCNDCHLPNDGPVRHYAWEAVVGVRDLVKHAVGAIPEEIEARPRSQRWIQDNCHRCHDDDIAEDHGEDEEFCWNCHDDVFHATEESATGPQ